MGQVIEGCVEKLEGEKFESYWPMISAELDTVPHIWADRWTKESIHDYTAEGRFQCWAVGTIEQIRFVCFSQIAEYPAARIFQIFLAFGHKEVETVPLLVAALEPYCQMFKCSYAEVPGRFGWEPELKKYGFERRTMVLSRKLVRRITN